ncbi:MAG TPA: hypothetical protein PKI14_03385 [Fervidobacterium sp.]|nr:hypothetical protein [Fervidobacterium sp.]HUM41974.1 hypothetical protein [Fervidobacterium sp.]
MANSAYLVLFGGTYFTLVLKARGQWTSWCNRYEGEQDDLSQPETLSYLGKVIYPEYIPPKNKRTFTINVNAYKSCTDNGSNLSLLFQGTRGAFDNRVKVEYPKTLKAICDFVAQYLEVGTTFTLDTDYYNLFMIGDETFSDGHFIAPKDRALAESMIGKNKTQFSALGDEAKSRIKTFPSLFASENHQYGKTDGDHNAIFGLVKDVRIQDNGIKICLTHCGLSRNRN